MSAVINPENELFDSTIGNNPDFQCYKLNNINAFRAIYEIVNRNGNFDKPRETFKNSESYEAQEKFKHLIFDGDGFIHDVENGNSLSKKIKQFYAKWPEISKIPTLNIWISNAVGFFSVTKWENYQKATTYYVSREVFPVYMNVDKYLDIIFDEDGNIREKINLPLLKKYALLAQDWRVEIDIQYQEYMTMKAEPNCGEERSGLEESSQEKKVPTSQPSDFLIEDSVLKKYLGKGGDVVIPDGVTKIDREAFSGRSEVTSITIAAGVTIIGDCAFVGCSGLTSVSMPEGVTVLGVNAFKGCSALTSIVIPASMTWLGADALRCCSGLTSLQVKQGNSKYRSEGNCIIDRATNTLLFGCKNCIIPNSVTSIGYRAFSGCGWLTSITIPSSVTAIGENAFSGCSGLTSIKIPSSVTSIRKGAFNGCSGLTGITIPDSVTFIGEYAFEDCSRLKDITIGAGVTSIEKCAFLNTEYYNNEKNWENGVLYIGNYLICAEDDISGTCHVRDGTRLIAAYAFTYLNYLEAVVIPFSVLYIGENAFSDCEDLTIYCAMPIKPPGWADHWYSVQNELDDDEDEDDEGGIQVVWACYRKVEMISTNNEDDESDPLLDRLLDPNNREPICVRDETRRQILFKQVCIVPHEVDGKDLLFVILKPIDEVEGIFEEEAVVFRVDQGADGKAILRVEENETIAVAVFQKYSDLVDQKSNERQQDSTTSNGGQGNEEIHDESVKSASSPFPDFEIEGTVLKRYKGQGGNVVIPAGVTEIGDEAFKDCRTITNVVIPNGVTAIGNEAFYRCDKLASVIMPDSVVDIRTCAFSGCDKLASIKIPNGMTSIGWAAFMGCNGLTSITIPDSVTSIGISAFSGCSALRNIIFGHNVTTIGDDSFRDCISLTSISIPDNVQEIGEQAFRGCDRLKSVSLPRKCKYVSKIFDKFWNSFPKGCQIIKR